VKAIQLPCLIAHFIAHYTHRQSRSPPILPPSLTLSRFPSLTPDPDPKTTAATPGLSHVLSHILPSLTTLPLSLHILNTTSFAPESKNEDLYSGWLQLPPGSVCVVTEGGVTEGGVFERGLYLLDVFCEIALILM
jgi:hypothetical protein